MKLNFKSSFLNPIHKNIATLFSGTLIAQFINVIGALILAKIYAPELYGTYSVFLSFVSILTIINSLKLEYIIITDKSEKNSVNMVNTLLIIIGLISIIHIIFFSFFKSLFINNGVAYYILIFSTIAALFLSNTRVLESLSTRKSLFKNIASARVIMATSTVLFQFVIFYISKDGLIYGFLSSMIITFIFYLIISKKSFQTPNFKQFKSSVIAQKNILKFAFPSGMINGVAIHIMPILMLSFFSASTSGIYSLSLKVVSVPLFIISSSVSQVYFQKASEYFNHSKHKLYDFTRKMVFTNFSIMIIILLLINTLGVFLLELFFDKSWENMNLYIVLLSFFVLGQAAFSPISSIIVITNKMHVGLIFNIILALINFIAIYVGDTYNNIIYTVFLLSIFGGLGYIILLTYFLYHLKRYK